MATHRKNSDLLQIMGYSIPKLYAGKTSYVGFYAFDPVEQKMKIKRIKLNHIQGKRERKLYATDLINRLYEKLRHGWNPWIESENSKAYVSFNEVCETYKNLQTKFLADDIIRDNTKDSYLSYLRNLKLYNDHLPNPIRYIYQLDTNYINDFLDHIYIDRGNTAQTRDNYLGWLRSFAKFLKSQGYHQSICTDGIEIYGKRRRKKQRTVLDPVDLVKLKEFAEAKNKHFLLACYILFYCFIRPKEMSKIRIGDISIKNRTIFISEENAKNRKNAVVTLNRKVIELMIDLEIFRYPSHYFLFSKECKPGKEQYSEKQFRDIWQRQIRKNLKFPDKYKFYSLKDTGVTMMLSNRMDVITVRDQARHSSILMTDIYTPHDIQEANPALEKFDTIF